MTPDPGGPVGAPESKLTIWLRLLGALGLIVGTGVGGTIGGWWWLLGAGILVGTALLAAMIDIARQELGHKPRHKH